MESKGLKFKKRKLEVKIVGGNISREGEVGRYREWSCFNYFR